MKSIYSVFKSSVKTVTQYYMLLVEETKSQRLVGSTNEWVLDNYYMISEQEKALREELRALQRGSWRVGIHRQETLWRLLENYVKKCHMQVDKNLMFRYLAQVQSRYRDYLTYPEVTALLPLLKTLLIKELADLCDQMRAAGSYHYTVTDKQHADLESLNSAARQNLLMMNIFNSLKKVSKLPMSELIDAVSHSERMLRAEKAGMYDHMQDKTKEDYRARVVQLSRSAKYKGVGEYELVKRLVARADESSEHVGWQLFPPKQWNRRAHAYIWIVALVTVVLSVAFAMAATAFRFSAATAICALLACVPVSQVVIDLFSWLLGKLHRPRGTFKLKFKDGRIPDEYATMVIMPTILKSKEKTVQLLEQLEVYYLSNRPRSADMQTAPNLYYTLVGDAAAYEAEDAPWDSEVVEAGLAKVKELNEKYSAQIFNFVYRRRAWSEGEHTWLGHERKRGAILHFNDLLLGQTTEDERHTRFRCETISQWLEVEKKKMKGVGTGEETPHPASPIRFVITLDTDTELVLYSAQKLIGAMAHPLNQAQLSPDGHRVDRGYGIMQPRVNVDVEVTNKSRYAQLFAGLGGLDVYTTASFELYQDIFNEGSFCGKGIYDLRVFQRVLRDAFPDNLILSHDLLEGCHIRCGLINDVELFDDNPSNYIDDAKRHHRWTRGDWQIVQWLMPKVHNRQGEKVKNQVNTIGRWKIFDNLRRSVLSLGILLLLFAGFSGLWGIHPIWFLAVAVAAVASPIVFFIVGQLTRLPRFGRRYKYYMTLLRGFNVMVYRSLVQFALLPKEAWMYTDAAVRACYRMWVSHRNLLNWVTSDEAAKSTKGTLDDYLRKFWFNYVSAAAVLGLAAWQGANALGWCAAAFCAVAWCGAPFFMYWLGRKFPQDKKTLDAGQTAEVLQLARDTWHFFDSLITAEHHYLIPDNYQQGRNPLTDYKTSPTNIGYSLTAVVSAAELKFITFDDALDRLSEIVGTVERLEKWNGHLFNWYHIDTLAKLPNYFVSTCDSGNFVACLYVVKGWLLKHADTESAAASLGNGLFSRVQRLIDQTDFAKLYNHELDVFSIGFDYGAQSLLPYHYNNFASEARLTSFLAIAKGDAPYKHWFCLDKTLVQYHGYKGVASWYGTLFEYFMPLIFLPTYKHTLMDETYSFALRAQRAFIKVESRKHRQARMSRHDGGTDGKPVDNMPAALPWGISETAYNELDDANNYKYHAFGVPYLKFQNTTPDRIVVSPYSSLMTISVDDRAVYENMQRFRVLDMYDGNMGFFESYDDEDCVAVRAHYAHHQGMILASLANYLGDHCLQRCFMHDAAMQSMETLLKEKAQVKPYIDLKVTQYKRYRYSKVQNESDAREFDTIANVPEIGVVSNGEYTVLMNDRGSGFSRYKNIMMSRYRKVSADHYGTFLYIRNLETDHLWSSTYSPLDVMPQGYRVSFAGDKLLYQRTDEGIVTKTEITVLKERAAELRRYTFSNNTDRDVELELTTHGEVLLATAAEDENHRVFAGMKVLSEYDSSQQALLFSRTVAENTSHYLLHKLWVDSSSSDERDDPSAVGPASLVEYETSRLNFLGRGGSLRHADVIESRRTLTGTVGTTLDPVMSMRRRVLVPAGKSVEAYSMTAFGRSREQLLQTVGQYTSAVDVEHVFKTAGVFNNMRTNLSLLKGSQMRLYCSMAKYLAQTAVLGSRRDACIRTNTLSQNGLWRFGISGDLAILLLEVDSAERSGFAKEMLRAFEYYKVHGLLLDLVIINDAPADERQGITHFVRGMAATEHLWTTHSDAGQVFVLDGDDVSTEERTLLRTVARISFDTRDGLSLEEQLRKLETANQHYQDKEEYPVLRPKRNFRVWSSLAFYNQYGGFDADGREYVVTNTNTPMPWVNVISNPRFGCVVSSTMAGFTFAYNAQQFKLTGWSNDIVRDNASEMLLIDGRQFVPATARHGQGWSAFDAEYDSLTVAVRVFVARDKCEKYYQIRLIDHSGAARQVNLDMVYKLVLGVSEEQTARYLYSEWDGEANCLRVRNVYHQQFRNTWVCLGASAPLTHRVLDYPNRKRLGLTLDVPGGGQSEVAFVISVSADNVSGEAACQGRTTQLDGINAEFNRVQDFWDEKLSHIQVDTPDPAFNYMINRWFLYQVYASRLYARAGFYQVGGATGFRDQLQDVMSILYSDPGYARRQILDHAAHQFAEGDVLHWWHESMHLGARTTFSDDYLWLPYVTYQYVTVTGDRSILDEEVPFCHAERLAPGEAERGVTYHTEASSAASLFEHLRRAVDRALSRMGVHGLPLMGCGDWNDGMSRVGVEGRGESVWVAFFLCDILPKMQQLAQWAPVTDPAWCERLGNEEQRLRQAIQRHAWDGNWFLRAYFDNGQAMGSRNNVECQIDLISQAWSILTDVATPEQKRTVFRETDARLVNREHEIIQLLTPPFSNSKPSPGYIANYPPGVRENGGQYTHGAMWYIMAQLKEGRCDMAYYLYSLINPVHRTHSLADVLKYKVEPYCIAADIYSNPQHPGRGGWTWYTGSASWAYKTGVENILGIHKQGDALVVSPRIPSGWQQFSVRYRHGAATYVLHYQHADGVAAPTTIQLVDDGQIHEVNVQC